MVFTHFPQPPRPTPLVFFCPAPRQQLADKKAKINKWQKCHRNYLAINGSTSYFAQAKALTQRVSNEHSNFMRTR